MRWVSTLLTAGLAEFAAHWLSLGWGFMVLIAGFVFVAVHVTAGVATVTSKASATEQRVNALVPIVGAVNTTANNALPKAGGTITGSLTVNGGHAVLGGMTVGGDTLVSGTLAGSGYGTLTVNALHANGSAITADGTITGHSSINADGSVSGASIHVSGVAQADNGVNVGGNTAINSSRAFTGASIHTSGNILSDTNFSGSYHGSQGAVSTVGSAPGSYSSSYETTLASAINGIISRLNSAGIT